jgi:hypothetical protein
MSERKNDEGYHRFMLTVLYMGRDKPGPTISIDMGGGKTMAADRDRTMATVQRQARNNPSYPKLCWTCGGWSRTFGDGKIQLHTSDHKPRWNGAEGN